MLDAFIIDHLQKQKEMERLESEILPQTIPLETDQKPEPVKEQPKRNNVVQL